MRRITHSVYDLIARVMLGFAGGIIFSLAFTVDDNFFRVLAVITGVVVFALGAFGSWDSSQDLSMEGIKREKKKRKK